MPPIKIIITFIERNDLLILRKIAYKRVIFYICMQIFRHLCKWQINKCKLKEGRLKLFFSIGIFIRSIAKKLEDLKAIVYNILLLRDNCRKVDAGKDKNLSSVKRNV